jgi:hypothetical protein
MSPTSGHRVSLWRGLSLVLAPLLNLAALASFAYGTNIEALVEARALFMTAPLLTVVTSVIALRRPLASGFALFMALLTFGLTLYGVAALSGAARAVSLFDRPSGLIALITAAWTLAALLTRPTAAES